MDGNEDPGANTEMFRVYVDAGETPAEGPPVARTALLLGVAVAVVVAALAVLLLM